MSWWLLAVFRLSRPGCQQRAGTGSLDNTSAKTCANGLYPEGLLHSRGTPGIVSRSQPTVWARQFFRRVIGPASPTARLSRMKCYPQQGTTSGVV